MNIKIFFIPAVSGLCLWACDQATTGEVDSQDKDNSYSLEVSCHTESLDSNAGVKIICNGDSIGYVLNGIDGTDGKNGTNGKDGIDGKDGVDGKDGADGKDGIDGKDGADGKDGINGTAGENGADGKNGEDGTSCTVAPLADSSGYKVLCGGDSIGVLLNGAKGEEGSSGSSGDDGYSPTVSVTNVNNTEEHSNGGVQIVVTYKDAEGDIKADTTYVWNGADGEDGKDFIPSSSSEEVLSSCSSEVPILEIASSSSEEVLSSSSSEEEVEQISSSSEELNEQCLTIRSTIDKFNYLDDVLPCVRSNEKVAYIIRHAERNKSNTGHEGTLNDNGRTQSRDLGTRLQNYTYIGDIYFMHTNVYRTMETAMLIAEGKGQEYSENTIPYANETGIDHEINMDLTDGYIIKDNSKVADCKSPQSWGWSAYSKAAYEEDNKDACSEAFYDVDDRLNELVSTHFTYEKMHDITIAISHDQLLVPFVAAVSQRQIDLRFHLHENDFDYWINYLTGIAIIVNENNEVTMIPVTALNDGFLRSYPNN